MIQLDPGGETVIEGGELYSYIHACSTLLMYFENGKITFVSTVCEHKYKNIAPLITVTLPGLQRQYSVDKIAVQTFNVETTLIVRR